MRGRGSCVNLYSAKVGAGQCLSNVVRGFFHILSFCLLTMHVGHALVRHLGAKSETFQSILSVSKPRERKKRRHCSKSFLSLCSVLTPLPFSLSTINPPPPSPPPPFLSPPPPHPPPPPLLPLPSYFPALTSRSMSLLSRGSITRESSRRPAATMALSNTCSATT